jgi:ribosomal protein S12 methylthiotransferase accessory factor
MTISFPGGKRVDATVGDVVVKTDQSKQGGGDGSAPEPYMHFLASIGTCAGIYVLGFCQSRDIPSAGIEIKQHMHWDEVTHKLSRIELDIEVPPSFPAKYHSALVRAADQCAVKKTLQDPPEFSIQTVVTGDDRRAESAAAV